MELVEQDNMLIAKITKEEAAILVKDLMNALFDADNGTPPGYFGVKMSDRRRFFLAVKQPDTFDRHLQKHIAS